MADIKDVQEKVHQISVDHGFYDDSTEQCDRDENIDACYTLGKTCQHMRDLLSKKLMLTVSELAEANEELRNDRPVTEVYYSHDGTKPEGFGVELADAVIRILDMAEFMGIDLDRLIEMKTKYNESRPFKHGRLS